MKPLPLNLASRPFRNNLLVGALLAGAGAALVFGTAYNLYVYLSYGASYATLQHAQAEDRARIAELQKQERALAEEIKKRDFRSVYNRGRLASELIRKSAFSWTQLFNTLETVIPPDVVLAAIRPNITSDGIVLRVEGVAKNHMALLTLEEKLQQHDAFKRVAPISERRLNPNLPDITFLVTCDYIPPQQLKLDLTAAKEAAVGTGTAAIAAPPADPEPKKVAVAGAAPGDVVGRDGQPKAADSVIAPGGLLIAEAIAAPQSGKGKKETAKKTPAGQSAPEKAAAAAPGPTQQSAVTQGVTTGPAAGGASPKARRVQMMTAPPPAAPQGTAPRPMTGPRGYDPNVPRTMPESLQMAANRPKPGPPPAAAQRLDLPLTFAGRPAGEVYRTLAAAHGVRIDLDPTVDPASPVTVNLQGRRLEEALQLLSGLLHTRTLRPAEGIYRVVSTEVRAPAADAPPVEEPIVEEPHR